MHTAARLEAYLADHGLAGPVDIRRVSGGQSNPTYFLSVGDQRLVLRAAPPTALVASAHDMAREFRVLSALHPAGVPVPRPLLFCADQDVLGAPFYVMQRVDGRILHDARLLDQPDRREIYLAQARALGELHRLDWTAAGLADLARPGSYLSRQVRRWTGVWNGHRPADVNLLTGWLTDRVPAEEGRCLVHGDFKLNNLVFAADRPVLLAILDWELVAIGDPLLDLAHVWTFVWQTRPEEYGGILGSDAAVPSFDEFAEAYYAVAGSPARLSAFHQVLALVRTAGIFHGIGQRAAAGLASADNAGEVATLADIYLDRALRIVRLA